MTLGERIKLHRQNLGLSQEALAEKLNVSRQAVTKWESDNGVPDIENLVALSKVMGVTLDELVIGKEEKEAKEAGDGFVDQREDLANQRDSFVRQKESECKECLAAIILWATICAAFVVIVFFGTKNGNALVAVIGASANMLSSRPLGQAIGRYRMLKRQYK